MPGIANVTQTTITTSPGLIKPANHHRTSVILVNAGSETIYLDTRPTVAAASGFPLEPGSSLTDDTSFSAWYGVVAANTSDIRALEFTT